MSTEIGEVQLDAPANAMLVTDIKNTVRATLNLMIDPYLVTNLNVNAIFFAFQLFPAC
jgi:hypothetical protein